MARKIILLIVLIVISCHALDSLSDQGYLVLGRERGEGTLLFPRHVKEGPNRNIYVLDQGDAFIKIFSSEGKYLKRMGGQGQGPGEIQRADGANFGLTPEGMIYFTETFGGHRWITLLDSAGRVAKLIHLDFEENFGIGESFPLKDGGFILDVWFGSRPERHKEYFLYRYPEALIRVDPAGKPIAEIVKTDHLKTISRVGTGGDQWIPFYPAFSWIVLNDDSVIFTDGLGTIFKVYDLKGNMVSEIKTDLPKPERVRHRDMDEWRRVRERAYRDKSLFNRFGRIIYKYKESVYKLMPNLASIASTPDGNILVSGPYKEGHAREFYLLNGSGKVLKKIRLATDMLSISRSFIFFVLIDKEENQLVICQKRRGTEGEDLMRTQKIKLPE